MMVAVLVVVVSGAGAVGGGVGCNDGGWWL